MTKEDIIQQLFRPVDLHRVIKAQGLAIRSRVKWEDVLAAMTPEQRAQVEQAQ